ncbi:hypothetical protein [Adhaeribacter aquaticus]|uniref:hypothetical protein n=1 Tax=Adhaeribacter aquaticus TaxID=299567 RepID=UPI00042031DB|nr:hypothetical protein [Adhaeribacter aquaticus]
MKRIHLFEFEDLSWFPDMLRQNMMDFLRFAISTLRIYDPIVPLLQVLVEKSTPSEILDLCSGGGGGIIGTKAKLDAALGKNVKITISDKFPNIPAFELVKQKTNGEITYITDSVDAMDVPKNLEGCRTIFSAFHHFNPEQARNILADAAEKRVPIGIFEGASKSYWEIMAAIFIFPVVFIFCTPFIKPFRLSRLFFTYFIPLIPLFTIWDGCVSILRLYSPEHLLKLTETIPAKNYAWKAGKVTHKSGAKIIYLIGFPEEEKYSAV